MTVLIVVVVIVAASIVVSRVMDVAFGPAQRVIDRQVNKVFDKLDERQWAQTQASQVRPVPLGRASFTRLGVEVASAGGQVVVKQSPLGACGIGSGSNRAMSSRESTVNTSVTSLHWTPSLRVLLTRLLASARAC